MHRTHGCKQTNKAILGVGFGLIKDAEEKSEEEIEEAETVNNLAVRFSNIIIVHQVLKLSNVKMDSIV